MLAKCNDRGVEMTDDKLHPELQSMRVVVSAMAVGVIMFAAIVVFLIASGRMTGDPTLQNPLLLALLAVAVMEIVAYVVVRKLITDKLRRRWLSQETEELPADDPAKSYQAITLIGAAMAEGWSLFGLVVLLITGNWLAIAAPAIGVVLIALHFPTRDKCNRFAGNVTGQHWG